MININGIRKQSEQGPQVGAGGLRRYMKSHVRFLTKHQRRAHPPPLSLPMPSRMGTMTRWTVVLVLAEMWRIKE